jgi:hypothetical protein
VLPCAGFNAVDVLALGGELQKGVARLDVVMVVAMLQCNVGGEQVAGGVGRRPPAGDCYLSSGADTDSCALF